MKIANISELKEHFSNPKLFTLALTHRSYINENKGLKETNERLEFLGDAVLEYVVSDKLYRSFPNEMEGYLTSLRASLVNTKNLSEFAKSINLGSKILLSKGEEEGGGRENNSLLADSVEALIGALFLDKGINTVYDFINDNILSDLEKRAKMPLKDAKSRFQEIVQADKLPAPKYQVISESGPDHNKIFVVEVIVDKKAYSQGTGKNKSEAEQNAAFKALEKMGVLS